MVGIRSMLIASSPQVLPGVMRPGHQAMAGTRCPPSHNCPLWPRNGPLEPVGVPPLSEKKKTRVRSARSSRFSVDTIWQTPTSISWIISR